ncbi:MAG: hypothetical protein ABIV94_04915 [Acidimicrobiales bacterium]
MSDDGDRLREALGFPESEGPGGAFDGYRRRQTRPRAAASGPSPDGGAPSGFPSDELARPLDADDLRALESRIEALPAQIVEVARRLLRALETQIEAQTEELTAHLARLDDRLDHMERKLPHSLPGSSRTAPSGPGGVGAEVREVPQ